MSFHRWRQQEVSCISNWDLWQQFERIEHLVNGIRDSYEIWRRWQRQMSSCVCKISFKSVQLCGGCCEMFRGLTFLGHSVGHAVCQNNSVVCLYSVVTRVHCAKTAEPIGINFGMSVAPDENSTALKFGDDRLRGWGTVPPNAPQNGQIHAFSCTVAKCVICLRLFLARRCPSTMRTSC